MPAMRPRSALRKRMLAAAELPVFPGRQPELVVRREPGEAPQESSAREQPPLAIGERQEAEFAAA
jgi:hypothetical protein